VIRLFHTEASEAEVEIASKVLRSGNLVMGQHIEGFAQELEFFHGQDGGFVPCASGTDALVMALEELGCYGWGVIVPALTFSATYEAVLRAGAIPVTCDVNDETGTPSVSQIRDAVVHSMAAGTGICAIVLVHLYGWPAHDLAEIVEFCHSQNVLLIEDCAQAMGSSLGGRMVGTFGDAAAFSFYPTKPLGGIGDGGAAYFPDKRKAQIAAARRNHGRNNGAQEFPGYNSRMDEVNAAVLRHRLHYYSSNIEMRRMLSGRYHQNGLKKLSLKRQGKGVPYVYPILVDGREAVRFRLAESGIESRVHYDPPVSGLPYVAVACPNADFISRRVLSLPCHHGMTVEDVDRICDAVRAS
jgi:dTDP-4-amino-4,6-dideoxygalactose transaminase